MGHPAPGHSTIAPVHDSYFADPFVWQHGGVYYAIGTGAREACGHTAGKIFPMLRSEDFHTWNLIDDALVRPAHELGNTFWAPAVACIDGTFYLYYSVGHHDKCHQLRVAKSASPEGPYKDLDVPLLEPKETPFAIDPHPFQDADGHFYLFYACDFLDCAAGARAGTALAMRALETPTRLSKVPHVVLRARWDWQRFQAARPMYGSVYDWHTLEGPCVLLHEQRYYCFYSGGRWENDTYGVDYGVAESVSGPYDDTGNELGPRVLQSSPGGLIGPGHNSSIVGPDGNPYLVFHAWNKAMTRRQMYIARLLWTPEGPRAGEFISGLIGMAQSNRHALGSP